MADFLSRFDLAQQTVSPGVFRWVQQALCPTIDRFATASDARLPTFNTFLPCPRTCGVDAFAQGDWLRHVNWVHPPPMLAGKVLQFLRAHFPTARVVMFLPWWPAAPWAGEIAHVACWRL